LFACLAVLIEHRLVTVGQTDRYTGWAKNGAIVIS